MSKNKKKITRKAQPPILAENSAANNAADNPESSPLTEVDQTTISQGQEATGSAVDRIGQGTDLRDRADQG